MGEKEMSTNRKDSAAAYCPQSMASSAGNHQWWDHFSPEDRLEAWTYTSTETQLGCGHFKWNAPWVSSDFWWWTPNHVVQHRCPFSTAPLPLTESVHVPVCRPVFWPKQPSVLLVIDEAVHQQPLLYELLPLGILRLQVAIVVVGHDDTVWIAGQLDDVSVIVAHHPLTLYTAGWCVHQDLPPLQLVENMLIWETHEREREIVYLFIVHYTFYQ